MGIRRLQRKAFWELLAGALVTLLGLALAHRILGQTSDTPTGQSKKEQQSTLAEPHTPSIDAWLRSVPRRTVAAASFLDITPGRTRRDELHNRVIARSASTPNLKADRWTVSVEPFKSVEIVFRSDLVERVTVEFNEGKPFEEVREQLRLGRFALVADETLQAEEVAWVVPERGLRLWLRKASEPLLVTRIELFEPHAEDLRLRAWRNESLRIGEILADLEYAVSVNPADEWALLGIARQWERIGYADRAYARLAASNVKSELVQLELARLFVADGRADKALLALGRVTLPEEPPPLVASMRSLVRADALTADHFVSKPQEALAEYVAAIQAAQASLVKGQSLERDLAREILLEAHTGAARAIANGPFSNRVESAKRWLAQAEQIVQHVEQAGATWPLGRGRVWAAQLACFVVLKDPSIPHPSETQLQQWTDMLLAEVDPYGERCAKTWAGRLWLQLAEAALAKGQADAALRAVELAATLLSETTQTPPPYPYGEVWLGQAYYLLGAVHAIARRDHRTAVRWYDRALPLLREPADRLLGARWLGNQWVSLAISYWETGDQTAAVRYTETGWQILRQAIQAGRCPPEAAEVARQNLAFMYRRLGQAEKANQLIEMARGTQAPMPPESAATPPMQ